MNNLLTTFEVVDFCGDKWVLAKHKIKQQRNGYWTMWAWVIERPGDVLKNYQELPFPVFTEWFE